MTYEISRQVTRSEERKALTAQLAYDKQYAKREAGRALVKRQGNNPNSILSKALNAVSRISAWRG